MNKESLSMPSAPYLYVIVGGISEVTNFGWSIAHSEGQRVVLRFLRGRKMMELDYLFDEFGAALQFPYYFGENWNAFDECIADLEWLQGDVYILVITDSKFLLLKEADEQLGTLIDILNRAGNEWSQSVETSEMWSRPAKPFHVLFQCEESEREEVVSRLESVNASFKEERLQNT